MQTVTTQFTDLMNGNVVPLSWAYRMAFDKSYNEDVSFFTLDTSVLDGIDVLSPDNNDPIQQWDKYAYDSYTDRVIFMEWTRQLEFPSSVSSAMADIMLENTDNYFTPNSGSPIDQFILPKRPLRLLAGFNNINLPQFVGTSEKMPVIDDTSKTATFHALDFLSEIYTMPITETISMQNATTDEVLIEIFNQFGILPSQYSLDIGINVIPFVFYDADTNAGGIFRSLMEAEMGNLWLDEAGLIRFNNRYHVTNTSSFTFDKNNVIDIKTTADDNIINTVKINADIRELQPFQPVYTLVGGGEPITIGANTSRVFNISLTDPCTSITQPTQGFSSVTSWYTAIKTSDSTTATVAITGVSLKTNSYTIFFKNNNAFEVTIDGLEVWGTPAKVIDSIRYKEVNQNSIDKYGEKVLEINNNFIQSIEQCDALSIPILQSYSEFASQLEIEVYVNPALQLNDVVTVGVDYYTGDFKVIKIENRLRDNNFVQKLTVQNTDIYSWFTLDQSVLDGTDVLAI